MGGYKRHLEQSAATELAGTCFQPAQRNCCVSNGKMQIEHRQHNSPCPKNRGPRLFPRNLATATLHAKACRLPCSGEPRGEAKLPQLATKQTDAFPWISQWGQWDLRANVDREQHQSQQVAQKGILLDAGTTSNVNTNGFNMTQPSRRAKHQGG